MSHNSRQEILSLVEKPSRYLGSEINRVLKNPGDIRLRFALAFPDLYEIATSHFGIQILYHTLNRHPEISAERVFAPAMDMAVHLEKKKTPLASLESGTPIRKFDVVGFSLLYELNYTNVLLMLKLSDIPFLSKDRDTSHPFIIAGGPCTVNPEPVAEFFDAMVIGDGETVVVEMAEAWMRWQKEGSGIKGKLLEEWSIIRGVYIPGFYDVDFDTSGFQRIRMKRNGPGEVQRAVVEDLDTAPFPDSPLVPFGNPVHDRLRLEISRGCTRGCRFCQAGMIYRPVRERTPRQLLSLYEKSISSTGYEDLSLLSLSTGDYTCIVPLLKQLMARSHNEHVAVSLPSLRAGTLTPEIMEQIKKVRKTGFTIAPEAGSQRLRDVINKNITQADIVNTVRDAFDLGWKVIKLYFMVGLPTETEADLKAIVDLVSELRRDMKKGGRRAKINVSIATFVPKPHTPFQWASQNDLNQSSRKIRWLKAKLKKPGIHFKWQDPQVSRLEGLWARGDRRLTNLLIKAFETGCVFDGWSDHFNYHLWMEAVRNTGVDIDYYNTRPRALGEPLPWDHVQLGVTGDFLKAEWGKAVLAEFTPDCRTGDCNRCGVCDFDGIEPRIHKDGKIGVGDTKPEKGVNSGIERRFEIIYAKQGAARFFGHLELMSIFTRAIRRAGIPVKFSQGFHPKPKISFEDPLPLGMESHHEIFWMTVLDPIAPETITQALNRQLPAGLFIKTCRVSNHKKSPVGSVETRYRVKIYDGVLEEKRINSFSEKPEWVITRTNRKGRTRQIDLKKMVSAIERIDTGEIRLYIISEGGLTVRPAEVLVHLFEMSASQCQTAKIVKEKRHER